MMFRFFFCLVAFCNFMLFVFGATQEGFFVSKFGLSKFRFSLSFSKSKKPASFPSRLHIFLTCKPGENDGPDNGKMWKGSVSPATLDLLMAWSILTAFDWPLNQKVRKGGRKMERNRESRMLYEFMMAFFGLAFWFWQGAICEAPCLGRWLRLGLHILQSLEHRAGATDVDLWRQTVYG